jgi:hypothetical protein
VGNLVGSITVRATEDFKTAETTYELTANAPLTISYVVTHEALENALDIKDFIKNQMIRSMVEAFEDSLWVVFDELDNVHSQDDIQTKLTGVFSEDDNENYFMAEQGDGESAYVAAAQANVMYDQLAKLFPALDKMIPHPIHDNVTVKLKDAIIHLNDVQKWTREEIADWLEELDLNITASIGGK